MNAPKRIILILILFSSCSHKQRADPLSIPDAKTIDNLFAKWNMSDRPGCAIGIVRNDSLIYSKGYGMANLEYSIPNSPETIFHMASVSKQFTAFSIVLLAQQGKLGLDDDIRKYLAWFPNLGSAITIRNLLNHTSGIRDQWQLLAIAGTRIDDVITQEQIVKVLSKQQALNFLPGEKYMYSNSGFTLLAEIVKSVTGQTLRQFADSAIFKPLGMNDTHFHDDYTEIVKNRSYSYNREGDYHYTNSILSYSNAGATSLFTNVKDMSKWIMNFYQHKVGNQQTIDWLVQKGKLSNGTGQSYALGISVEDYHGYKQYSHSGGDAGYRTFISIFPEQRMGFIVFSNLGDFDPGGKAHELTDIFFPVNQEKNKVAATADENLMNHHYFPGHFISEEGVQFDFIVKNGQLCWKHGETEDLLTAAARDTFIVASLPEVKFVFSATAAKDSIVKEYWPGNERVLAKYTASISDQQLQTYSGTYYCPELDCKYGIAVKDQHLVLTNNKYDDAPITLYGKEDLFCDYWWMSHLKIIRDSNNNIIGLEVNTGRIMHLRFNKT